MVGGLAIGLFVITLSVPLHSQDRDKIEFLASNLSDEAQKALAAMQYNSMTMVTNDYAQQLYWALMDFADKASQFSQYSQDRQEQPATLRNLAQILVDGASGIDDLVFKSDPADLALWEWSDGARFCGEPCA